MKRITFITTIDHNVGDDFVREGLKFLFRKHYQPESVKFTSIHKHSPITVRYGFERMRDWKKAAPLEFRLPVWLTPDRIRQADLLVQSGAPVYWCFNNTNCANNEWYYPLVERRARDYDIPVANLAAGTCQPYFSDGTEFDDSANGFITKFFNQSNVTTFRDQLSKNIAKRIGIEAPVIPCSSIFARDEHGLNKGPDEYVALNYMRGGAHYATSKDIDFDRWEETFKEFYFRLKERENVVLSCHNDKEYQDAKRIDPKAKIFYKAHNYVAYLDFYSKAKYGIYNRVHAAFATGSFGRPSFVIGNDTRALMVGQIGLTSSYVNDVDTARLIEESKRLENEIATYPVKFKQIREKAYTDYLTQFTSLHKRRELA